MFEMLGNWFIGDYFKEEVIVWLWELFIDVYKLFKDCIYVIVFGGDEVDGLLVDEEVKEIWKKYFLEDYIFYFDRKDNFWEMGDIGLCGFCLEIYIDMCLDEEWKSKFGVELVNMDDFMVVEIWNNVFIQFNCKVDCFLEEFLEQYVDIGMGFE